MIASKGEIEQLKRSYTVERYLTLQGCTRDTHGRWDCTEKSRHHNGDVNHSVTTQDGRAICWSQGCYGPKGVDVIGLIGIREGLTSFPEQLKRLRELAGVNGVQPHKRVILRRYRWTDAEGREAWHLRWNQGKPKFTWALDTEGKLPGRGNATFTLYERDHVEAAREIILCEGERDADTLNSWLKELNRLQTFATTTPNGAGDVKAEYLAPLLGKALIFVSGDRDKAGEGFRERCTSLLSGKVQALRVLLMPEGSKDWTEWAEARGTAERFHKLLKISAPSFSGGPTGPNGPPPSPARQEAVDRPENTTKLEAVPPVQIPGYRIKTDGVFEDTGDADKPEVRLTHACCEVIALCRDGKQEHWGAYLRWNDRDGKTHQAAFPVGRFHEPGGTLPAELADAGLPIVPGMEKRLLRYLASVSPTSRYRVAIQTGWHEGVFVLPSETIGEQTSGDRVVFLPERQAPTSQSVSVKGTFEDWKREVAARCIGNPPLAFWMSASLAAPLLHPMSIEGGGFHLNGLTSLGKTTTEQVAASVWGDGSDPAQGKGSSFIRKWNLTKNATEGLAEAHNDLPLLLDEIGEADTKEFSRLIYSLAGGQGKGRMRADATLKPAKVWRILLLSTGEVPVSEVLESEGRRIKGGQAVRLLDIPATDPITGEGVILNTHGASSTAAFVDDLKRACGNSYGWAGPEFVKAIIREGLDAARENLQQALRDTTTSLTPKDASPEIGRAVKRFALVAVAGEKAISIGLLPWNKGEALRAATAMLNRHLLAREGSGNDPERAIERVKSFLLAHGASRFRDLVKETERIVNLAGYRDNLTETFYLTSDGFKEACGGANAKDVARLLKERGLLRTPDKDHLTERVTVPGVGRTRLYVVSAGILDDVPANCGPVDR